MTHIRRIANLIGHPRDCVPPSLQDLFLELAEHYRNTSILTVDVTYKQDSADIFSHVGMKFMHNSQRRHQDLPKELKEYTRELFEELFAQLNQYEGQHPTGFPPTPGVFRWDLRRGRLENIQSIRLLARQKISFNIPPCAGFNRPLSESMAPLLTTLGLPEAKGEGATQHPIRRPGD